MSIKMEVNGELVDVNSKEIKDYLKSKGLILIDEGIEEGIDISYSLDAVVEWLERKDKL